MKWTNRPIIASLLCGIIALSFTGCSLKPSAATGESSEDKSATTEKTVIRVGASPAPHAEILSAVKEDLAEKGYDLQITEFTDYILPNQALSEGDLDANYFQHKPYLDDFNAKNGTDLVSAGAIHFEPLGIYKGKSEDLANIADSAQIAVPNDTTNEARALQLLQAQGLIQLKEDVGLEATVQDISENPKNIKIVEIEAAQVPRTLPDVDFAIINGNYALEAGVEGAVLLTEDKDSDIAQERANIIAVRSGDESRPEIQALVQSLQSEKVKTFIEEKYGSTVIPVF